MRQSKYGDPKKLDFVPETFRNICRDCEIVCV